MINLMLYYNKQKNKETNNNTHLRTFAVSKLCIVRSYIILLQCLRKVYNINFPYSDILFQITRTFEQFNFSKNPRVIQTKIR